jgi:hypothetical protein
VNRNGFRKPNAQISGRKPAWPTNGLSGGNEVTHDVAVWNVDVYPKHLAEQHGGVLRAMVGIVPVPPSPERNVEIPVRPEHQVAGIVVRERLRKYVRPLGPPQIESRGRIGAQRIGIRRG